MVGLQIGSGLSIQAAATTAASGTYEPVADLSALLALSPSDEDRAYVISHDVWVIYLDDLGQGMWIPEVFTTGSAGSIALHADVEILLDANNVTGVTDGNDVTTWPNAGSAGNFTEATNPPSWHETAGADGRAAVRFAGASEIMSCADNDVARNTGRGMGAALFKPATVNTTDRAVLSITVNTSNAVGLFYLYYDTVDRMGARRLSADAPGLCASTANGNIPSAGVWKIILGIADWTDNNLIVESDTETTYTLGVDSVISTAGSTEDLDHASVTIGKTPGLSDPADMDVQQIWFVRDEVFNRGDLVVLGRYLELMGGL